MIRKALPFLAAWWFAGSAAADVEIAPLRQVISPDDPVATFTISNPTDRILDGRVSWVDLAATETGYAPAAPAQRAAQSAAPYLAVAPAQFRLEPGARIDIIVQLRDGRRVPIGERRSHLLIETAASRTPIRKASDTGLQVDVGLGVSAPVMLRNRGEARAKIGETKLLRDQNGLLLLETRVEPEGDISSYGRLETIFAPADPAQPSTTLGIRRNVAGYLDAPFRTVETPLGQVALGRGTLTVRYIGEAEFDGIVFDERSFEIMPPPASASE